ncbi:MAG: glycosyl transferase family 2, partial [Solirubrobacterales bacterium]|nr:glycosyl transferase family 2 [Solirubrobacterales bacterium]
MRVGVLVPVHGFAPFLAEALDSVLAQDVDTVVVVVDDGSPQPVVLHPDHAAQVTLVRRPVAGGPAQARATGLERLDADISLVALCDADDAWCLGALTATVRALDEEPEVGWAFGRALVVGPDGRPSGECWVQPPAGRLDAATFALDLYAANPVPTSSIVLRRVALRAAGGFASPVRVAEDWELWLRLCGAGADALCVPGATVRYRRHPGGLTADVTGLATAQLAVHEQHAQLVGPRAAHQVIANDHAALAAGLARDGDYSGARAAWAQVGARRP